MKNIYERETMSTILNIMGLEIKTYYSKSEETFVALLDEEVDSNDHILLPYVTRQDPWQLLKCWERENGIVLDWDNLVIY